MEHFTNLMRINVDASGQTLLNADCIETVTDCGDHREIRTNFSEDAISVRDSLEYLIDEAFHGRLINHIPSDPYPEMTAVHLLEVETTEGERVAVNSHYIVKAKHTRRGILLWLKDYDEPLRIKGSWVDLMDACQFGTQIEEEAKIL